MLRVSEYTPPEALRSIAGIVEQPQGQPESEELKTPEKHIQVAEAMLKRLEEDPQWAEESLSLKYLLERTQRAAELEAEKEAAETKKAEQTEDELHIRLDDTKRKRQVEEITKTDYFRDLQSMARKLRGEDDESTTTEEQTPEEAAETLLERKGGFTGENVYGATKAHDNGERLPPEDITLLQEAERQADVQHAQEVQNAQAE